MSGAQIIKPPEWHARRAKTVGSSEIAALFGCQAGYQLSHYALWHVKAGTVPPPDVDTPRTRAGIMLEDAIAALVAHENGWQIVPGQFALDPTTPGMSCTPDWEIMAGTPPEGASGPGILECKNIDMAEWKRTWTNGEPPLHILLQLQHQLACKGYEWGAIGGFIGGNTVRTYPYLARPRLIADIRRRVTAFWQSIDDHKPPLVDGSASAADVLRGLYPEIVDDALDLRGSNEWPEACAEFIAAGETKRDAEKNHEACRNRMVALMAGHKRAWGGGFSVSCSVTPEKPDRPAIPGDIIKGRKEVRTYRAKQEQTA